MNKVNAKLGLPYLAFEERPNSFVPVDLMNLDIINKFENEIVYWNKKNAGAITLGVLDSLLSYYTKEEIIESIKRSNTIVLHDYNVPLVVRYNSHTLPLITKDNISELDIMVVIKQACDNKNLSTKFKNKYKNILDKYWGNIVSEEQINKQVQELQEALEAGSEELVSQYFNYLPYEAQREIILYYFGVKESYKQKSAVRSKKINEE